MSEILGMESNRRKRGPGRDLWAAACHIADAATAKAGYRVGTDSVFRALSGRRPRRGGSAVRAAIEEAGFHAPPIEDET